MYDWANSAFVTTIISAVFPPYFSAIATAGDAMSKADATAKLSLTTTIALVIGAFLAPIVGAIGDRIPVKKKFLGGFMTIGAVSASAMFVLEPGSWVLAAVLFAVGNIAATGSFVFYDSLLPHIAGPEEIDRVSTAGYALGYVGGGLLLAVQLAAIAKPSWFGIADADTAVRLSFLSVGVWWFAFSIPLFRHVAEPPVLERGGPSGFAIVGRSIMDLGATLKELKRYRQAFLFMVAFLIYNDGIGTIIRMAAIFGDEIGVTTDVLIGAILLTQFVGVGFAFLFGALAAKIGAKRSIYIGLAVYAGISVLGYFIRENWHFLALALLVGMVQGGTQALSRSLFASLIPKSKSAEFFGLFAVFERFAGVLGPLVFTIVVTAVGSSRPAIFAIIGFFAVGALLLGKVDIAEGQRAAREAERRIALGE